MTPQVAIIQFPGSNCEYETQRALQYYGLNAQIFRWNAVDEMQEAQSFVLPGGFSYQDRVRAGAISAKLPVVHLLENAQLAGKPILGICNGCQILAETGLMNPVIQSTKLEVAMAPNTRHDRLSGFACDWVYVRIKNPQASLFTRYFLEEDILPIPINHGEGRFVLSDEAKGSLSERPHVLYCSSEGEVLPHFPTNPNGSQFNLAALCNPSGNVMGIMPHPERAAFGKQLPSWVASASQKALEKGPWALLFESLADYLNGV